MGYYIVADINHIGTSQPIKESNSSFSAPAGQVLVGRMHTGDENKDTTYKYAPLIADPNSGINLNYKLQNTTWTAGIKQSDLSYAAPDGWVIVGRKHDGDPGVTVLWKGLQHLVDVTAMYRIMRHPPPSRARIAQNKDSG